MTGEIFGSEKKDFEVKSASPRKSFDALMSRNGYGFFSPAQIADHKYVSQLEKLPEYKIAPLSIGQFRSDALRNVFLFDGRVFTEGMTRNLENEFEFTSKDELELADYFINLTKGDDIYDIDEEGSAFYLDYSPKGQVNQELAAIKQYIIEQKLYTPIENKKESKLNEMKSSDFPITFDFAYVDYCQVIENINQAGWVLNEVPLLSLKKSMEDNRKYKNSLGQILSDGQNFKEVLDRRKKLHELMGSTRHQDPKLNHLSNVEILQKVLKNIFKPLVSIVRKKMAWTSDKVSDAEVIRLCRNLHQSLVVNMVKSIMGMTERDNIPSFGLQVLGPEETNVHILKKNHFMRGLVSGFALRKRTSGQSSTTIGRLDGLKVSMEFVKRKNIQQDFFKIDPNSIIFLDSVSQNLYQKYNSIKMEDKEMKEAWQVNVAHLALKNQEVAVLRRIAVAREMGELDSRCSTMIRSLKLMTTSYLKILNEIEVIFKHHDSADGIKQQIALVEKKHIKSGLLVQSLLKELPPAPALPKQKNYPDKDGFNEAVAAVHQCYKEAIQEKILNNFNDYAKEKFKNMHHGFSEKGEYYGKTSFVPDFLALSKATVGQRTIERDRRVFFVNSLKQLPPVMTIDQPTIVLREHAENKGSENNFYDVYFIHNGHFVQIGEKNLTFSVRFNFSEEQKKTWDKQKGGGLVEFNVREPIDPDSAIEVRSLREVTKKIAEKLQEFPVKAMQGITTIDGVRACIFALAADDNIYNAGHVSSNTQLIMSNLLHTTPLEEENALTVQKKRLVAESAITILIEISQQSPEMKEWATTLLSNSQATPLLKKGTEDYNKGRAEKKRAAVVRMAKGTAGVFSLALLPLTTEGLAILFNLPTSVDSMSSGLTTLLTNSNEWLQALGYSGVVVGSAVVVMMGYALYRSFKAIGIGLSDYLNSTPIIGGTVSLESSVPSPKLEPYPQSTMTLLEKKRSASPLSSTSFTTSKSSLSRQQPYSEAENDSPPLPWSPSFGSSRDSFIANIAEYTKQQVEVVDEIQSLPLLSSQEEQPDFSSKNPIAATS